MGRPPVFAALGLPADDRESASAGAGVGSASPHVGGSTSEGSVNDED